MRTGELAKAGDDVAFRDNALQVRNGHIGGKWSQYIYMSPSMLYSGLDIYAKPLVWMNPDNGAILHALHCLIEPGTYDKVASTSPMYGDKEGKDICISDFEIEWRTKGKRKGSHIITSLLVRL